MRAKSSPGKPAIPVSAGASGEIQHRLVAAICAALVILTVSVYWQVRGFEFVNYDDTDYVSQNATVLKGLSWANLKWAFTTGHASNWHPVTWLSHMIDVELFGARPAGHHITNLILHAGNTVLLFLILMRITKARWRSAFVAALFALHPLHVESVAWVSERKDVLSTALGLLSIWAYVRYTDKRVGRTAAASRVGGFVPHLAWYLLALCLFALGLMAKPMLVTWPFILLLLDWWPLRRIGAAGVASETRPTGLVSIHQLRLLLWEKVPFFVLTAGSCVVTFLAQKNYGAVFVGEQFPLGSRLANAVVSYLRYLEKTVWPHDLAVPYPLPGHWPAWLVAIAAGLLLVASAVAFQQRDRRPYLFVGWFWYIGTLVPVIGVVQVGMQSMADRYTYVPLIGIFIALVWAAAELSAQRRIPRVMTSAVAAAALAACAFLTLRQLPHWRNTEALFNRAVSVTKGNFMAHYNLANKLSALGRNGEAIAHYEAALRIRPDYANAHNNLGTVLDTMGKHDEAAKHYALALASSRTDASCINAGNAALRAGKIDEAIAFYREALRLNPNSSQARHNLGFALMQQRKFDDAIAELRQALQLNPGYVDAYHNLGIALLRQGKVTAAIESFSAGLQLDPNRFETHSYLATALSEAGRMDEAMPHLQKALELRPDDAQVRSSFGVALAQQGRMAEAIQELQQAIRTDPKLAHAYGNLGNALASQGRIAEAVVQYRKAIEIAPEDEQTLGNLATALAEEGKLDESIEHFKSALKLNPGNAQTHFNFGLILLRAGRKEDAITQFQEVLRIQPDHAGARQQLTQLGAH